MNTETKQTYTIEVVAVVRKEFEVEAISLEEAQRVALFVARDDGDYIRLGATDLLCTKASFKLNQLGM